MARTRQQAEQLEQLLAGGVRAEGLEDAGELGHLADLAHALGEHVELATPSPAFREALRQQLLVAPAPAPAPADLGLAERARRFVEERATELAESGRAVAAAATGAAVVAAGGTVGVAQQSLPGDLLHPVKDLTEDLRLAFTSGDAERGRLHLAFAEERIRELEDGVGRLSADLIADTLDRLDEQVLAGANDLLNAFQDSADALLVAELRAFTTDAGPRLHALADLVPPEVAGRLDASVEVLRRVEVQIDVVTGVGCDCEPAVSVSGRDSFVQRPGEGPAVGEPCDCVPAPRPAPAAPAQPEPESREPAQPQPEPAPEQPEPAVEDPETVPRLPAPIDPIGDAVEEVVDDLLEQLPVDPVEQLPEEVREPVQDTRREVNRNVGEVSQTVDDLLP